MLLERRSAVWAEGPLTLVGDACVSFVRRLRLDAAPALNFCKALAAKVAGLQPRLAQGWHYRNNVLFRGFLVEPGVDEAIFGSDGEALNAVRIAIAPAPRFNRFLVDLPRSIAADAKIVADCLPSQAFDFACGYHSFASLQLGACEHGAILHYAEVAA